MPRLKKDIFVKSIRKKLPPVTKIKIGRTSEYEVVEQPKAKKSVVSEKPGAITCFKAPLNYGTY